MKTDWKEGDFVVDLRYGKPKYLVVNDLEGFFDDDEVWISKAVGLTEYVNDFDKLKFKLCERVDLKDVNNPKLFREPTAGELILYYDRKK